MKKTYKVTLSPQMGNDPYADDERRVIKKPKDIWNDEAQRSWNLQLDEHVVRDDGGNFVRTYQKVMIMSTYCLATHTRHSSCSSPRLLQLHLSLVK